MLGQLRRPPDAFTFLSNSINGLTWVLLVQYVRLRAEMLRQRAPAKVNVQAIGAAVVQRLNRLPSFWLCLSLVTSTLLNSAPQSADLGSTQ